MIGIDGLTWNVPCKITRTAALQASDISGLTMDLGYMNDVYGTYMSYDVELPVPQSMKDEYSAIYELLTDPVDGHSFTLPYNQDYIQITGRVMSVKDVLYRTSDGNYWEGCSFTVISNYPSKFLELGQVLTRGRTPAPGISAYADYDEVYF